MTLLRPLTRFWKRISRREPFDTPRTAGDEPRQRDSHTDPTAEPAEPLPVEVQTRVLRSIRQKLHSPPDGGPGHEPTDALNERPKPR